MSEMEEFLKASNPWWADGGLLPEGSDLPRRKEMFLAIAKAVFNPPYRRSVILLGQRRVGKTVTLEQLIGEAIKGKAYPASNVCYADFDSVGVQRSPEKVVAAFNRIRPPGKALVLFDEIQKCKNWESEVKYLTDHEWETQFVVTGSAASSLKRKSTESGVGRFLDYYVHPLYFSEYVRHSGNWGFSLPEDCGYEECLDHRFSEGEISSLNGLLIDYMRYGAFPELGMRKGTLHNPHGEAARIARDTIIRTSTPQLYGIGDAEKLEDLFIFLVRNNGQITVVENMANDLDMNARSILKYLQFLLSAYLIRKHDKISSGARAMLRNRNVKYILMNPASCALYNGRLTEASDGIGHFIEATAISQHPLEVWPREQTFYFSRNVGDGNEHDGKVHEVDIVRAREGIKSNVIEMMCEIKWSDKRIEKSVGRLREAKDLVSKHLSDDCSLMLTTKSSYGTGNGKAGDVLVLPTSQYCLAQGRRTLLLYDRYPSLRYDPGSDV